MGAWGTGTFENDTACDFAAEVAGGSDLAKIESVIDQVLKAGSGYVEAPDAEEALAAADIVARLKGNFGPETAYTKDVDNWVRSATLTVSAGLLDKSRRAVSRVLAPPSELLELWSDAEEFAIWKSAVDDVVRRLG